MLKIKTTQNQILIQKNDGVTLSYAKNELIYSFDSTILFLKSKNGDTLYSEGFADGVTLNGEVINPENITEKFESIFYNNTGLSYYDATLIVNDFIDNKHEIAKAIQSKGIEAEKNESIKSLSQKILKIEPANPVFLSSGNLNPRWTDLQEKIGQYYNEGRKHAWAFSFLGFNRTFTLSGGDYYICSDGFESDSSVEHTFGRNPDNNKQDSWVIIYTQNPTYVFPEEIAPFIIGAAFYNTLPTNVKFYGTKACFISVDACDVATKTMLLPESYARNTAISYFQIPEGIEEVNLGEYAFADCTSLIDFTMPLSLKTLNIGNCAFQNCSSLFLFDTSSSINNLENIKIGINGFLRMGTKKSIVLSCKDNLELNNGCFSYAGIEEITLESKNIRFISYYAFTNSTVRKITINALDSLYTASTLFNTATLEEIHFKNPLVGFNCPHQTFLGCIATKIILEKGWNWSINLSAVIHQSLESMVQNAEAYADRTGTTPLTYSIGATKLAILKSERPDIIELLQSKNININ